MFGIFNRIFLMILGYAYPAYECYKTLEKNKCEIEELQFWCQYWIIVAILSVLERIGDVFISWLPMYGEMKLALFVYLWYPKVKGSAHIYGNMLRPYMTKHETAIDRTFMEVKTRAWDYFLFYWSNWAKMGQSTLFQVLQYIAAQSSRAEKKSKSSESDNETTSNGLSHMKQSKQASVGKNWPPTPPPFPGKLHRSGSLISMPTRSKLGQNKFSNAPKPGDAENLNDATCQTRLKLRRYNLTN